MWCWILLCKPRDKLQWQDNAKLVITVLLVLLLLVLLLVQLVIIVLLVFLFHFLVLLELTCLILHQFYITDCLACPAGYYCNSSGLAAPSGACSPGYYCPTNSTIPMTYNCPAGSYCPSGSSVPLVCPLGTYQNQTTSSSCLSCPAGYYCSNFGSAITTPYLCSYWLILSFFCTCSSSMRIQVHLVLGLDS